LIFINNKLKIIYIYNKIIKIMIKKLKTLDNNMGIKVGINPGLKLGIFSKTLFSKS